MKVNEMIYRDPDCGSFDGVRLIRVGGLWYGGTLLVFGAWIGGKLADYGFLDDGKDSFTEGDWNKVNDWYTRVNVA